HKESPRRRWRFAACEGELSSRRRSYWLSHRPDARATHDRTTRHAAAEIHLPRRRTRGNLAHRGERNHRRRFALWPLRQSHRAAAFRQSRPHAAHLAHLPAARRAPSHRLRPTIRCPESPSRRLITELGQLVSTGGSTTPGFV